MKNKTSFNPKRGRAFLSISSPGGGGFRPPLRSRPRSDEKILKFGTYVEFSQYARADEIAMLKIKAFFELCKFMLIICMLSYFLIITDKMRPFRAFKNVFDIVVETFNIFLNLKKRHNFLIFLMYFIVLWISYVFSLFLRLMYFYCFFSLELFEYWISINIAVILTVMKANTAF